MTVFDERGVADGVRVCWYY